MQINITESQIDQIQTQSQAGFVLKHSQSTLRAPENNKLKNVDNFCVVTS